MNYLQYKSDEMYSSTQLIRQSKMIFDKLNKNEIEKAIILRDGRPSFMLLDFQTYEKIMTEYMQLKQSHSSNNPKKTVQTAQTAPEDSKEFKESLNEKEQIELEKALEDIENLDLSTQSLEKEELKEFWD